MAKGKSDEKRGSLTIDHVADFCRRYPGEAVTFYTRVGLRQPLFGFTVRVILPEGLVLEDYEELSGEGRLPLVEFGAGTYNLTWSVEGDLKAGSLYEYRVQATVAPTYHDLTLSSRAVAYLKTRDAGMVSAAETATVTVPAKGRYLRYLPAIYEDDELMGRFLMLFESFLAPIGMQIGGMPFYFDPKMTPAQFLPWLASWLSLTLNDDLSEERRRRLISLAVQLYRKRGTKLGLQEYLEIYTGGQADIVENRARDFRLGPEAILGPGVALGTGNRPHTFFVTMHLPPLPAPAGDEKELARQESERRHRIESIIEAEKPAHTFYTLQIETAPAR